MRTMLLAAATAATVLGPIAAEARPLVVVEPAAAPIVLVAGGCGFGFHRGPYGGCLRNGVFVRPVIRVAAPLVYGRGCFTRWTAFGARRVCR